MAAFTASVFAQGWGRDHGRPQMQNHGPRHMAPWGHPGPGGPKHMHFEKRENIRRPDMEAVTLSGELVVERGGPALKSGDVTYILGGVHRLTGFVDGFKEGARITVEGSALSRQKEDKIKFLMPARLTINGKTYDMAPPRMNPQNNRWPGEKGPGPNPPNRPK